MLLLLAACGPGARNPDPRSPFVVADSLRDERRFAEAHPHYRRLRDSLALAGDSAGWWRAQLWWAHTLTRLGRTDSSASALEEAFRLAGPDSTRQAWTWLMQCGLWSRLGRSEQALEDCGRALAIAEAGSQGDLQAMVHQQLGTVYSRRGLYRRSVRESEQAVSLERRYGHSPHRLAGALNSLGVEYAAVGRLSDAAAAYEEGLAITRQVHDTSTGGYLISNLAALRAYTGRLDQAIELMVQSLASARALGDTSSMVYAHNSLSEYLLKAGNRPGARDQVEQALALAASAPAIYRVIALANLGLIAMAEGQADSAARVLGRAGAAAVAGGFAFERFRILGGQVRLAIARTDRSAARRLVTLARTVADSLGAPDAELDALALEGAVAELERRPDASRSFLDGIALLESWRGRLAMGDLRLGLSAPKWDVYEGAIRTLLTRGDTVAAFEVSERARARMLLEVMAERGAPAASALEAGLKQRLRERSEEAGAGADSTERRLVEAELAALRDSLAELERRPSVAHPLPPSLPELRSRLLSRPGTALFEVFWGDSAVYGWWITRDRVRAARLGRSDSLEASLDFLRRSTERPGGAAWRPAANRLHQVLLAPLITPGVSAILAVVDGPLARVPLEVLVPAHEAAPLGATHQVIYGPSAGVLASLTRTGRAPRWERAMLAAGVGVPGRDLPFAEREARSLRDLYQREGADLLVGGAVTLDRWLGLRPERYRFLHFATHTSVSDREPDQSQLLLAGGVLDLPVIRRLHLTAELVTLSACETAIGRRVRGEGVVGLSHAFLAAGARSTLVTLWPVADRATARFMTSVYREVRDGRTAAEALRLVRSRWIESGSPDDHPAAWAPFILLGDPALPPL